MLPEFDLRLPQNLDQALQLLAQESTGTIPVAGSTNLTVDLRSGKCSPKILVNLKNLPELGGIRLENDDLVLGSGVTLAEILRSPLITEFSPALKESAGVFANPLIRNNATVGGNLADASPAADTAPPLLVHAASVELASAHASRSVPLDEFFLHVRKTALKPGEIITAIRFKKPDSPFTSIFYKLGLRKADVIAIASVAVYMEKFDRKCRIVRIAMGSVAPKPLRAYAAEALLAGQFLTPALVDEAARLAAAASDPIDDIRGSAGYRRRVIKTLTARLLSQAAGNLELLEG